MADRKTAAQVRAWLDPRPRIWLFAHERADGDAIGALVGLCRMLRAAGSAATAVLFEAVSPGLDRLLGHAVVRQWTADDVPALMQPTDGIVLVDTCARAQLGPLAAQLQRHQGGVLAVDHHLTRDDIADCAIIDPGASSACLLVAELADLMGWAIDGPTAEALFSGMATDTGWFRFSNTDGRTLRMAARMIDLGVQPDVLYRAYCLRDTPARLRLIGRMLQGLEMYAEDRVALVIVTRLMIQECGAQTSDLDELVQEPQRLSDIEASALLMELPDGGIKVSLRSRQVVDCAAIAATLGGGGHARAAGVRLGGSLAEVQPRILELLLEALP